MNAIPIQLLRAFVVFSESANISDAAAKLRISQPALSKQLQQLEALLPGRAFALSGRKKVLTPFGRDLHRSVSGRIGSIDAVVNEAWMRHADPRSAQIRLGARRGILDRLATKIRFPGSLFFEEMSNREVVAALLALRCELGILHTVPDTHELVAKPLFRERFRLVIPKRLHPKRPVFGKALFAELKQIPCVGFRPGDEVLQAAAGFSAAELQGLRMVRATENYQSLAQMVEAGMGWAVVPDYLEISPQRNWVLPVPEGRSPAREFYLAYRAEFAGVPWFRRLLEEIRACFAG